MFEGDSADTLTRKFPLVSMGGRAEGLACADPVARTPIGASGNSIYFPLMPSDSATVHPKTNLLLAVPTGYVYAEKLTKETLINHQFHETVGLHTFIQCRVMNSSHR